MIYAEFDFDKGYDITQFSFTPRGDVGSGFITKATLKVKNTANGEYKTVATDQVFRADSKKKTFTFDEQTVYGVRLEITDANEHGGHKYVAVSEFDIANTPARTNTVYAHGKSYAAGTDGALDLATGKAAGQIAGSAEDLDASKPVYRAEVKGGTTVTLTAEQVDGLEFVGWFAPCSKEPVSTDASCKVTARSQRGPRGPLQAHRRGPDRPARVIPNRRIPSPSLSPRRSRIPSSSLAIGPTTSRLTSRAPIPLVNRATSWSQLAMSRWPWSVRHLLAAWGSWPLAPSAAAVKG